MCSMFFIQWVQHTCSNFSLKPLLFTVALLDLVHTIFMCPESPVLPTNPFSIRVPWTGIHYLPALSPSQWKTSLNLRSKPTCLQPQWTRNWLNMCNLFPRVSIFFILLSPFAGIFFFWDSIENRLAFLGNFMGYPGNLVVCFHVCLNLGFTDMHLYLASLLSIMPKNW